MIAAGELEAVVTAAIGNDPRAWERLIGEFTPMIRSIARRHRLACHDQDEVVQETFLALMRHISRIREPRGIGGWIATTAGRASLQIIRSVDRERPTEDVGDAGSYQPALDEQLLYAERRDAVRSAAAAMPARQRAFVAALAVEPALSMRQISERLDMPIGSIGPTRQRCLERMRRDPLLAHLVDEQVTAVHRPARTPRPPIDMN